MQVEVTLPQEPVHHRYRDERTHMALDSSTEMPVSNFGSEEGHISKDDLTVRYIPDSSRIFVIYCSRIVKSESPRSSI